MIRPELLGSNHCRLLVFKDGFLVSNLPRMTSCQMKSFARETSPYQKTRYKKG